MSKAWNSSDKWCPEIESSIDKINFANCYSFKLFFFLTSCFLNRS